MLKPGILFLCTGNSCRSQMAEAWARHFHGSRWQIESAGIEAHGMNQTAVAVMREEGLDLSDHYSKTLNELDDLNFDLVITVCGNAHERCPVFPGKARVVHQGFEDPPLLAKSASSPEEVLTIYRRVRDQIRDFVHQMPQLLEFPIDN